MGSDFRSSVKGSTSQLERGLHAQERDRRAQHDREQLAKLAVTRTALENIEPIVDNVVDIVTGQLDGYDDLSKLEKH